MQDYLAFLMLTYVCPSQVKLNERGIASLAYNVLLRPGVTLGLGASFDTQNLTEASHKVCLVFFYFNANLTKSKPDANIRGLRSEPASPSKARF